MWRRDKTPTWLWMDENMFSLAAKHIEVDRTDIALIILALIVTNFFLPTLFMVFVYKKADFKSMPASKTMKLKESKTIVRFLGG